MSPIVIMTLFLSLSTANYLMLELPTFTGNKLKDGSQERFEPHNELRLQMSRVNNCFFSTPESNCLGLLFE